MVGSPQRKVTGCRRFLCSGAWLALPLASLIALSAGAEQSNSPAARPLSPTHVDGKNSVSGLEVKPDKTGGWTAEFDYFYNGDAPFASLHIQLIPESRAADAAATAPHLSESYNEIARPGAHHVSAKLHHPGAQVRTGKVELTLREATIGPLLAREEIAKIIDWPDLQTWIRQQQLAGTTSEETFSRAVTLIDEMPATRRGDADTRAADQPTTRVP